MIKIGGKKESSTKQETLDPTAKSGLDFLINQAKGLGGAPLVPELSAQTIEGIGSIGTGLGGVDPLALSTIQGSLGGEFAPGGREALERASGFAAERAEGQVSDIFTAGGRTGSPAQAKAVAEGVASAVAPFAFGFEQEELKRQDAFRVQQISTAFGLQNIQSASDLQEFQGQIAQLEAAGLLDAQARAKLEEPFRRLGLISGTITSAATLEPRTTEISGGSFGVEAGLEFGELFG